MNADKIGKIFLAAALAEFAVQHIVYIVTGAGLGPPFILDRGILGCAIAAALLVLAVAIAVGWKPRVTAICLGVLFISYALIVYPVRLFANVRNPNPWTSGCELLAIGSGALLLASIPGARFLLAATLMVFGVQHFLYGPFIATLIQSWMPWHLFWAYGVGVAFVAAALSIATGKMVSLGATLLAAMFLLWFVTLHMPRVFGSPTEGKEWTSAFVALGMAATALFAADLGTSNKSQSH
jgi:hypothetical protein